MRVGGQAALQDSYPGKFENKAQSREAATVDNVADLKKLDKRQEMKPEEIQEAVVFANKAMKAANYHLEFELHEKSNRFQVRVIDSDSGEIIREIPTDAMMKFADNIKDTINHAVGLLVDESI